MNEVQIFKDFEFGEIRVITINGEPWFVGKDVANTLGYKDSSDALKRHVDEEDKLSRCFTDSGQRREMYIINESGLYSLILSSKLPTAKKFKHWVTSEVLPAIRKGETNIYKVKDTSLGEITSFLREMDKVMRDQNSYPSDIAAAFKDVCEQFGIKLPKNFIREPQVIESSCFLSLSEVIDCD